MNHGKRAPFLAWSSAVYPLEAADVVALPDFDGAPIPETSLPDDPVVLLIRPDRPDVLLRGRALLQARSPRETVEVRVVFASYFSAWNLPAVLIRPVRKRLRYKGTAVYHVSPSAIRALGLERTQRTLDNIAPGHEHKVARLYESLRAGGYDDAEPINVALCRRLLRYDSIRNGHHRVAACIALGIGRMAVQFSASGRLTFRRRPFSSAEGRNRGC